MDNEPAFAPPYNVSWATFLTILEKIAAEPPNRVDRSYLSSQSGAIQTYLIAALKAFGLIDESARPTDLLLLFADTELRKEMVADLLKKFYPTILPLGETNSTGGELAEAFSAAFPSLTGESRVKGIRFFLSAAQYADIKLSPMWKAPKAPRGSSVNRRPKRNSGGGAPTPANSGPAAAPRIKATTLDEMKLAYFDLLINNADKATNLDSEVLTRIERLIGVSPALQPKRGRAAPGTEHDAGAQPDPRADAGGEP